MTPVRISTVQKQIQFPNKYKLKQSAKSMPFHCGETTKHGLSKEIANLISALHGNHIKQCLRIVDHSYDRAIKTLCCL